jgi:FAD/FMN-containing dehydrogenase
VTADGRIVRADRDEHPDLFWALRGGGGSFGIVTALELQLFPVAEVYAGILFFPLERAAEVLNAWREWTAGVPDEVTSVGRLLRIPPLPDIPEPLRGRDFAVVEATFLGSEADAAELLRPLRELGPELDTFATIPAASLSKLHMDPEQPVPGVGDGTMLRELTAETIDALVAVDGPGVESPLVSLEVRHLGGALDRPSARHGALSSLEADFLVFAVGIPMTPEIGAAVHGHVERVRAAMAPWESRQMYLNFAESRRRSSSFHTEEAYRRLRRIKTQYDPGDLFRSNHPIPPLERARRHSASRAFRRAAAARLGG